MKPKRFFQAILVLFVLTLAVSPCWATAGSVTANKVPLGPGKVGLTLTWLTDSGAGTVPSYTIHVSTIASGESVPFMSEILGAYMYEADVVPSGTVPPTGAYTITLTSVVTGCPLDGGGLTSVAVGTDKPLFPPGPAIVDGDITVAFSGSPGNGKSATITLKFVGSKN